MTIKKILACVHGFSFWTKYSARMLLIVAWIVSSLRRFISSSSAFSIISGTLIVNFAIGMSPYTPINVCGSIYIEITVRNYIEE